MVDPSFASILADPRNAVRPPPKHVSIERFRRAANAALTSAPKPPIEAVEDHLAVGPAGPLPVRLYRPASAPDLPVVVFLHGGGFVFGDLETHDPLCRTLARKTAAAVAAVAYRLAPEARFPAPIEDCHAALFWAATQARTLGLDPMRIALCGDSAGGSLALAAALLARARGPALAHLALLYPALDPSCASPSQDALAEGYLMTREALRWFWSSYLGSPEDAGDPLAAPLLADLSGLPPTTVVTAEYDPLRDEGEALADRLSASGVTVTRRHYAGMIHGFASLPYLTPIADIAIGEAAADIRASFNRATAPAT